MNTEAYALKTQLDLQYLDIQVQRLKHDLKSLRDLLPVKDAAPEPDPTEAELELDRQFRASDAVRHVWRIEGTDDPEVSRDAQDRLEETLTHMDAEGLAHLKRTVRGLAARLDLQDS